MTKVSTAQAWLEITIAQLEQNIWNNDTVNTQALVQSIEGSVKAAGDDPELIELVYLFYGKFLDMGVGRGRKQGSSAAQIYAARQEWYGREINYQVKRLAELMRDRWGDEYIAVIKNQLPGRVQMYF